MVSRARQALLKTGLDLPMWSRVRASTHPARKEAKATLVVAPLCKRALVAKGVAPKSHLP